MLTPDQSKGRTPGQRGTILLEALIAILLFSLGILALVGLQASTMKASSAAKGRIDASLVANQRIATMWIDRSNWSTYLEPDPVSLSVPGLPNGTRTTTVNGTLVTVTVSWQLPAMPADTYRVTTDIVAN